MKKTPEKPMNKNEKWQMAMFDKIELELSKRPFSNDELIFILKAIRNSKSYVVVFECLKNN